MDSFYRRVRYGETSMSKQADFKIGDKIKLDAEVTGIEGQTIEVTLKIYTTAKDLLLFDDPQETSPFVD